MELGKGQYARQVRFHAALMKKNHSNAKKSFYE